MQIDKKTNFSAFEKALTLSQDEVIAQITSSGLRGMSGSNSPTGAKWESVRNNQNPNKLLICNADEGEPGTFKDVYILKHNPELLIEGMVIAAYAIGAKRAYIYLRTEYRHLVPALEEAIRVHEQELKRINLTLDIFQGAGAYICGEETSLINSIEGLRGEPRQKPPFPTEYGLWGMPTCVNNVTTLAYVPLILEDSYKPLYLFSLSGNVQQGGIYEFPLGVRAEELIDCGHPPKADKSPLLRSSGRLRAILARPKARLRHHKIHGRGPWLVHSCGSQ